MRTKKSVVLKLAAVVMIVLMSLGLVNSGKALAEENLDFTSVSRISTDVKTASAGYTLLGLPGRYISDVDNALARINAIRKEACKEGVIDAATGRRLTKSDYVPVKWSKDLEYIARIRAAEAALTFAHLRTNGNAHSAISSPDGVQSEGEILVWTTGSSVLGGIEVWYSEKDAWVNNTPGMQTGHYTKIIDPRNRYIGLGTFCSDNTMYYTSTAGEFSTQSSLDTSRMSFEGDCIQMLEVANNYLDGSASIKGKVNTEKGKKSSLALTVGVKYQNKTKGLYAFNNVTWTSSNKKAATVSDKGKVTAVGSGKAVIKGKLSAGRTISAKKTINIKASSSDTDNDTPTVILSKTVFVYNGKAKKPGVVVRKGSETIPASAYTVKYSAGCREPGKYKVVVTFTEGYKGKVYASFTILPKGTSISKVKAGTGKLSVLWKRQKVQVTGYQIQYSLKKNFKSAKTITVAGASKTGKVIKNLKTGRKYYIRVRTYKKVGSKNYCSSWSKAKTAVVK